MKITKTSITYIDNSGTTQRVSISPGNIKTGRIPAYSIPPVTTCVMAQPDNRVPCARKCYALKAFRQYKATQAAWVNNFHAFTADSDAWLEAMLQWFARYNPPWFRIHVSGDFFGRQYFDAWHRIAQECAGTRFLAFTKARYESTLPNYQLVYSMWPGWGTARAGVSHAWMQDGTETRIPAGAIECPGNCETCHVCWSLSRLGHDVVFAEH